MELLFPDDNGVIIKVHGDHQKNFANYSMAKEKFFRKICTYMINNNIIDKNLNFIDAGAQKGDNSIPWALNIKGLIYAIEPGPQNYEFIRELKELNKIDNLIIIPYALSNINMKLSTNDNLAGASFIHNGLFIQNGHIEVSAVHLDYLYNENIIDNIGFIHLDVEGMESLVIEGAEEIIKKFNPIITFEQHIEHDDYIRLTKILQNKNYIVYLINECAGDNLDCRNLLAIPKDKISYTFMNNINSYLGNNILSLL